MALPTYTMSCFLLPKTVCRKIASIMSDFWWKTKGDSRGMHWKSWDQLARPKGVGGLGFKDIYIEAFNLALLGKQLWRFLTHPTRIFKSRYFAKSNPLSADLGSRPSQQLIKQGARVKLGNGRKTNIWLDHWIQSRPARSIKTTKRLSCE